MNKIEYELTSLTQEGRDAIRNIFNEARIALKNFLRIQIYMPTFWCEDVDLHGGRDFGAYIGRTDEFFRKTLEKVVELEPKDGDKLADLGKCYLRIENTEEAQKAFEKAVKLNRKCDRAYYYLGKLYFKQGRYGKSKAAFKKAARLGNRNAEWEYFNFSFKKEIKLRRVRSGKRAKSAGAAWKIE